MISDRNSTTNYFKMLHQAVINNSKGMEGFMNMQFIQQEFDTEVFLNDTM